MSAACPGGAAHNNTYCFMPTACPGGTCHNNKHCFMPTACPGGAGHNNNYCFMPTACPGGAGHNNNYCLCPQLVLVGQVINEIYKYERSIKERELGEACCTACSVLYYMQCVVLHAVCCTACSGFYCKQCGVLHEVCIAWYLECFIIDCFLGDAFVVLSCPVWSTVVQCGAQLPIHTLNYCTV